MKAQQPQVTVSALPAFERREGDESAIDKQSTGWGRSFTVLGIISVALALVYLVFFLQSLPLWFHPGWTTDDALQQWFPFIEVLNPGRFEGDLLYQVMKGYLAPLHYWSCAAATLITGDAVVASHWIMLLQIVLSGTFLFLAVRAAAGTVPAIFSLLWLLHTRQIVQRFTAGLPRGWSGVVIPAFFYFAIKRNHTGVLITLLLGCLSHPPTTLVCAGAYGIWLLKEVFFGDRAAFIKPLIILICLSPIYAFVTWKVVERPESVGQMVSYEEAQQMPQFQVPTGRFPFLPHPEVTAEWKMYAFQAFTGRFYKPVKFFRRNMRTIVVAMFFLFLGIAWYRGRPMVPTVLLAFFVSLTVVYFLSRPLAFKLYVPNRHLQFPMAFFWITAFPILVWRALHFGKGPCEKGHCGSKFRKSWLSFMGLVALGGLVWAGSSTGLIGSANFNYSRTKKGQLFEWARKHSPEDAVFAGHPKLIDGMMLFGERRAFATNETYHPFYSGYLKEIERRLELTFRAHYAENLQELAEVLEDEKIDYFVFDRKKFYPESLEKEKFYPPLDGVVEELTSRDPVDYAYKLLPREVNTEETPYLVFRDDFAVIIDLHVLRESLAKLPKEGSL